MQYNKNPISLREGHALIDGVEVMDGVKMTINFTPETWTGRQLNETTPSTRWVGATITGSMTRRRTNNWLKTKIKEYQATKALYLVFLLFRSAFWSCLLHPRRLPLPQVF